MLVCALFGRKIKTFPNPQAPGYLIPNASERAHPREI